MALFETVNTFTLSEMSINDFEGDEDGTATTTEVQYISVSGVISLSISDAG